MSGLRENVGIVGYWYATNYGSVVTYYALYRVIERMGFAPLLIDRPAAETDPEGMQVFSRRFMDRHCRVSGSVPWEEMHRMNQFCDTFVVGSDQVWTRDAMQKMRGMFFLGFADDRKRKIAYAPSFGFDQVSFAGKELDEASRLLHRFHAVSVREESGKRILEDKFMMDADWNLDPVFLLDVEEYRAIAAESKFCRDGCILAYILDPTEEKEKALQKIEKSLGKKVYIILDGRYNTFRQNAEKFRHYGGESLLEELQVEDWVRLFEGAAYLFTDSHHGLAMGIIFEKPLICFANHNRGYTRFVSLLGLLGVGDRMVQDAGGVDEALIHRPIDYMAVGYRLRERRGLSEKWLYDALRMDLGKTTYVRAKNPDFERCRMVVSMVRQYGIRHVVLSSGTRNLTLCRFFENNACFHTHMVIDERSAAFYGMGLALQLGETVALCCTSGTAVSNYLSAVTESYYQGVPLVVITADRYPCFQNNLEDQTIPQASVFADVCKKTVTLPVNDDALSPWESRRLIAEALLEVDHHGRGPVQINVPLNAIQRKPPAKSLFWLWNYRKISRTDHETPEEVWRGLVEELLSKKRILIVYGQSAPLGGEALEVLKRFVERFSCTLLRDHLSNLPREIGVLSYPVLKNTPQAEFNRSLAPQLVISIGGRRMLNDPVTYRLRGTGDFVHWRVCGDGMPADPFRKLSMVFECSADYFLRRMLEMAGDRQGDGQEYRERWQEAYRRLSPREQVEGWQMKYIIKEAVERIPSHSLVHISIGNTIMYANSYQTREDVEVFCNMGTNGIDGCASTFMGHAAAAEKPAYLLIGDCSFFYDMNSLFNKKLGPNIRILLVNNNGAGLLRDLESPSVTQEHGGYSARAYAESLGFLYLSARDRESFEAAGEVFFSGEGGRPVFLEAFCE